MFRMKSDKAKAESQETFLLKSQGYVRTSEAPWSTRRVGLGGTAKEFQALPASLTTHLLAYLLAYLLTYSLAYLLAHLLTYLPTYLLPPSFLPSFLTHSLTYLRSIPR